MSRYELVDVVSGHLIAVGDTVTVGGVECPVVELEAPEPDFGGCVHYTAPDGKAAHASAEDLGAVWHFDGQPVRWDDSEAEREQYESGGWTREDTESMERGRDLPMRNEAGEWL